MELACFQEAGGLDSFLLGFLGVGGGKRLKAKAIDRVVSPAAALRPLDVARGRAVAPSARAFIRRAEALRFRSECIDFGLDSAFRLKVCALVEGQSPFGYAQWRCHRSESMYEAPGYCTSFLLLDRAGISGLSCPPNPGRRQTMRYRGWLLWARASFRRSFR